MFIGKIYENIGSLVYGNLFKVFGNNWNCYLGNPCYIFNLSDTNQFLFENFIFFLSFKFDAILVMNLYIIITFFISIFVFFKFYFYFIQNKYISILLSILLISSPYFGYQIYTHYELGNIWITISILYFILKAKKSIYFVGIGVLLGSLIGISNYIYVYFNIVLFVLLLSSKILSKKYTQVESFEFLKAKNIMIMYVTSFFISILLMIPFLTKEKNGEFLENIASYSRGIENFVIFSSRPWYFFLPSEDNPFYGKITTEVLTYFRNSTQNYLFNNYFKSEHSASFFGITNILLAILGLIYIKKNINIKDKFLLLSLLITLVFSILFALPPWIVLFGYDIYLPSYLIYYFFPMFRVLSRFGVYSTAILLIFSGFGLVYIKNKFLKYNTYIILVLFTLAFSEFFMRINITIYDKLHPSFSWVNSNSPSESILAVYPLDKSRITIFWLPEIQRKLINPMDFKSNISGFDSEKFTESLTSKEGLEKAKENNVSYLIVFSDSISEEDKNFFETTQQLEFQFSGIGESTDSIICRNLLFIFNCRDASDLGEVKIFKFR